MLDIKFIRENPEIVKENIKKKFQEKKLVLVDEVIELDVKIRDLKQKGDNLRKERNDLSGKIGMLMREKKVEEANAIKAQVVEVNKELAGIEPAVEELQKELREKMLVIPNIIDPSVPIGEDDSCNVENEKYGEPFVPEYEIPAYGETKKQFRY